jgi:hypothetical protein
MRLIAGEIADDARDPKEGEPLPDGVWPWSALPIEGEIRRGKWRDGLVQITGMSARAISRTLADLAAAGYEMRTPITDKDGHPVTDKRGRVVFAARGHALRFQVPPLAPRPEPESSPDSAINRSTNPRADSDARHVDNYECSPNLATNDGERSPLLVRKVAESGDPIPSVSPQVVLSPQSHIDLSLRAAVEVAAAVVNNEADSDFDGYRPDTTTREGTDAERRRQADLLAEWMRQHPETVMQ